MDDDKGFLVSLKLEEDVETELEDFAFRTRLGIDDEAMYMVENVLWNHLDSPAVAAELIQYLVDQNDWHRLRELMHVVEGDADSHISSISILYDAANLLLKMVTTHETAQARCDSEHSKPLQKLLGTGDFRWTVSGHDNFGKQAYETFLYAANYTPCNSIDSHAFRRQSIELVMAYHLFSMETGTAWEVVRVFAILCMAANRNSHLVYPEAIFERYHETIDWIDEPSSDPQNLDDAMLIDKETCRIWAKYSFLMYCSMTEASLEPIIAHARFETVVTEARKDIRGAISELIQKLPNSSPRGSLLTSCEGAVRVLEKKIATSKRSSNRMLPTDIGPEPPEKQQVATKQDSDTLAVEQSPFCDLDSHALTPVSSPRTPANPEAAPRSKPDWLQPASGSDDRTVGLGDAMTMKCLQTLKGHGSCVTSVAFSPNGQKLASGSYDRTVRLWDTMTGQCLQTLKGHGDWVTSVAFSPDGQKLASGSEDKTVRLWDTETGQCLQTLEGHGRWVTSVAFSPNGQQLASGSDDRTVRLWDATTGQCLQTLKGHGGWIRSVAFSPDWQRLASGSDDKTVRLWDTKTGQYLQTLKGHRGRVMSVVCSPDGQKLASGSDDKTVRLWDTETGQCLQTLEGHRGRVTSVACSPDGQKLASGSDDKTVRLWDTKTGQCLQTLDDHGGWIRSVAFSPDSQKLASGSDDKTVQLWVLRTRKLLPTVEGRQGRTSSAAFSPEVFLPSYMSTTPDSSTSRYTSFTGHTYGPIYARDSGIIVAGNVANTLLDSRNIGKLHEYADIIVDPGSYERYAGLTTFVQGDVANTLSDSHNSGNFHKHGDAIVNPGSHKKYTGLIPTLLEEDVNEAEFQELPEFGPVGKES